MVPELITIAVGPAELKGPRWKTPLLSRLPDRTENTATSVTAPGCLIEPNRLDLL
jgi:hypothetical protein